MRIRSLGLMLPSLAVAGCSSGSEPSGADYSIEIVTAPPAQSLPGDTLKDIVIRVVSRSGVPLANVTVTWAGDGAASPASSVTDQDGNTGTTWILPQLDGGVFHTSGPPGDYTLTAALGDASASVHTAAHAFRVEKVSATRDAACAILNVQLWCWGQGNGIFAAVPPDWNPAIPVPVPGAGLVTDVRLGYWGACVLQAGGIVKCVSRRTDHEFVPVDGAPPLYQLTAGGDYYCGLAADQTAWCWQVDLSASPSVAVQVSQTLKFVEVSAGGYPNGQSAFACGRTAAFTVFCWGANQMGQLGDGSNNPSNVPVGVNNGNYKQVLASRATACGVTLDDDIRCWGEEGGILTTGSTVPVFAGAGLKGPLLAVGHYRGYVPSAGTIWGWYLSTSVQLPELTALQAVTISEKEQMCILTDTDEVFCSWILMYGGNESTVLPSAVVPVPPPAAVLSRLDP